MEKCTPIETPLDGNLRKDDVISSGGYHLQEACGFTYVFGE